MGNTKEEEDNMTLKVLKREIRLCFRKWDDFTEFQKKAEKILSKEAWENSRISPYPKTFIWFQMLHLTTEEIGQIIELAYEIVNK